MPDVPGTSNPMSLFDDKSYEAPGLFDNEFYYNDNTGEALRQTWSNYYGAPANVANPFYQQVQNQVMPGLKLAQYYNNTANPMLGYMDNLSSWMMQSPGNLGSTVGNIFDKFYGSNLGTFSDPSQILMQAEQASKTPEQMMGILGDLISAGGFGRLAPQTFDTLAYLMGNNMSAFKSSGSFDPTSGSTSLGGDVYSQYVEDTIKSVLDYLGF
jgi:hypothetical protein